MKRPIRLKKTVLALAGIAASVGCAGLIAARPWATTTGRCWERLSKEAPLNNGCCRNIDRPVTITTLSVCPTPAPKKPHREGYFRHKCERCGQEYDVPPYCTYYPTDEEMKHLHLTPEEEARSRKAALKLLDNPDETLRKTNDSHP